MNQKQLTAQLQMILNENGENLKVDGDFGPKTEAALKNFRLFFVVSRLDGKLPQSDNAPAKPVSNGAKVRKLKIIGNDGNPYHPRFEIPEGYTHAHPLDVLRTFAGEKEILGSKDNPLIAHFHEHSANLGSHSEGADYSDEVPHCSSALNWAADMAGCEKTNHALAVSWKKYNEEREGDLVEEGDIITLGTRHVTLANKRFNRKTSKTFEGFGSNQGNSIKTSLYNVSEISAVRKWKAKVGTKLAPIMTLEYPASGVKNESVT